MASPFQSRLRRALRDVEKGRYALAVELLETLRDTPPTEPDDAAGAGRLALAFGEVDLARGLLSVALEADRDNPELLTRLGDAYAASGEALDAFTAYTRALDLEPDRQDTRLALARLYLLLGQHAPARDVLEEVIAGDEDCAEAHCNLARALDSLDAPEPALVHARRAARLAPDSAAILSNAASIILGMGRSDEARGHLDRARKLAPLDSSPYFNLAHLRRHGEDDAAFIEEGERILEESLAPQDRIRMHFALGKLHDDCGRHAEAFEHYRRGNLLARPADAGDPNALFARARRLKLPACRDVLGELPVFVVGMPRSGTTLLERILSSHPEVAAAGELPHLTRMTAQLAELSEQGELTREACEETLEEYRGHLAAGREQAARVTDKMPANYLTIGVIHALMPKARILHCRRDPLDTGLSCYFQNFRNQHWATDLEQIARVYGDYRRIMAHWRRVLPPDRIEDVRYEALVDDVETEARRLVAHLGLAWDPACLDFTRDGGRVATASRDQVRRPIYRTSLRRWEAYLDHIEPLLRGLEPYLEEQAGLLAEHGVRINRPFSGAWFRKLLG